MRPFCSNFSIFVILGVVEFVIVPYVNNYVDAVSASAAYTSSKKTTTTTSSSTKQKIDDFTIAALPLGDVNVLVVTDIHSWLGGHGSDRDVIVSDTKGDKSTVLVKRSDADHGDILSFYERLKEYCDSIDIDLWFVMNGDWVDGSGLSLNGDVTHLVPLLEKIPYDLINVGNHEMYSSTLLKQVMEPAGLLDWFHGRYISSNVIRAKTNAKTRTTSIYDDDDKDGIPFAGQRKYQLLVGKKSTILAFGFLYDMSISSYASDVVTVKKVEDVVKEKWFVKALQKEQYDAILILAHMGCTDPLLTVLLTSIRNIVGIDVPIQFLTGHTHVRDYCIIDSNSASYEAGKYLDTIGFVSFPVKSTVLEHGGGTDPSITGTTGTIGTTDSFNSTTTTAAGSNTTSGSGSGGGGRKRRTQKRNYKGFQIRLKEDGFNTSSTSQPSQPSLVSSALYQYVHINANRDEMLTTLVQTMNDDEPKIDDITTVNGQELSDYIYKVRAGLGLLDQIGCFRTAHILNRTLHDFDSLWGLFQKALVPYVFRKEPNTAVLLFKGDWRYDFYPSIVTVDDVYGVSPYNSTLYKYSNIPTETILALNDTLNVQTSGGADPYWLPGLPNFVLSSVQPIQPLVKRNYTLIVSFRDIHEENFTQLLSEVSNNKNNTGRQQSIPVQPPQPLTYEYTTSQIWITYIKEKYPIPIMGCMPSGSILSNSRPSTNYHTTNNNNNNNNKNNNNNNNGGYSSNTHRKPPGTLESSTTQRTKRLHVAIGIFVSVAILGLVLILFHNRPGPLLYQHRLRRHRWDTVGGQELDDDDDDVEDEDDSIIRYNGSDDDHCSKGTNTLRIV